LATYWKWNIEIWPFLLFFSHFWPLKPSWKITSFSNVWNFFGPNFPRIKNSCPLPSITWALPGHCHCELVQRFHCSQKREEDVSTSIHLSKCVSYSEKTSTLSTESSCKLSYSHNNIAKHGLLCNTPLSPNGNTTKYASTWF
jgi:hypothetical protein